MKLPIAIFSLGLASNLHAQAEAPRQFKFQADSPRFWTLFAQGSKLEKVAGGFTFIEGPVWDKQGFLYVSDEQANKVFR